MPHPNLLLPSFSLMAARFGPQCWKERRPKVKSKKIAQGFSPPNMGKGWELLSPAGRKQTSVGEVDVGEDWTWHL